MDMLVVGIRGAGHTDKKGCTDEEYRTQFGMWAMLCSPLMAGCDIRSMDKATAEIMLNKQVLEVNQDPLGKQAKRVSRHGDLEIWTKPMSDGSIAVALLNRGETDQEIELRWRDIGLLDEQIVLVRDLWSRLDVAETNGKYARKVVPHATELLRLFVQ
jgi:alpha-galactosidase